MTERLNRTAGHVRWYRSPGGRNISPYCRKNLVESQIWLFRVMKAGRVIQPAQASLVKRFWLNCRMLLIFKPVRKEPLMENTFVVKDCGVWLKTGAVTDYITKS
jgi:hypothetical protein